MLDTQVLYVYVTYILDVRHTTCLAMHSKPPNMWNIIHLNLTFTKNGWSLLRPTGPGFRF